MCLIPASVLGTAGVPWARAEEPRTVTLRVAADETYRAQNGWEGTIRSAVGTVSDIYTKQFQIRFVIRDIVPWTLGESTSVREMVRRLQSEIPSGDADVIVAFTRGRCAPLEYGAAMPFDRVAIILTGCPGPNGPALVPTEVILSHEMGHLFGAFHVLPGAPSVMRGGPADRFDSQTTRVIRLMRAFDFRRGVLGLDEATRRAWSAIYAEGHEPGGVNPLAAKIALAGMDAYRAGHHAEAEADAALRVARDMAPADPVVRMNMGLLHSERGQIREAEQDLAAARTLNPGLLDARTELGFVLVKLDRDLDAFAEFRAVITADPHFARARVGLALVLTRLQRIPDAINQLAEAARLEPRNGNTQYGLAVLLYRAGSYDEAWQAVKKAQALGQQVPPDFIQSLEQKAPSH
jgi:Flp pilus assembly protein TadD